MLKLGPGDENGYAVRFIRFAIIRKIESIDAKDRGYLSIAKLLMHFYNRPVPHIWTVAQICRASPAKVPVPIPEPAGAPQKHENP